MVLANAKTMADKNPGYEVYDWNGERVYPQATEGAAGGVSNADCPFLVKVDISDLNIRKGAGTNTAKTGIYTGVGVFTILEVKSGKGSDAGWGRLKSGAGWISLDYCTRIQELWVTQVWVTPSFFAQNKKVFCFTGKISKNRAQESRGSCSF